MDSSLEERRAQPLDHDPEPASTRYWRERHDRTTALLAASIFLNIVLFAIVVAGWFV